VINYIHIRENNINIILISSSLCVMFFLLYGQNETKQEQEGKNKKESKNNLRTFKHL
jgi:hypothetical protein